MEDQLDGDFGSAVMHCTFCDTPVNDGAIYCHQCGSLVSDAEGQASVTRTMNDSAIKHLTELLREDAAEEFEIGRQLGRGGMAVVFLAKETKLDRQVAIKVLPPELTFGHGVERFMREAKTAAKLDHPSIIPIYRISDGGKIFWYAMKYLEGQSLDQRLADSGPMQTAEVLALLTPVADALDYAHDQHVIHRDIKPANIMLDTRGRVIVTDFGIAKALTEGTLTASGSVIGTPYFMSPEQGMGKAVSGASDQYAVAVMAYRMLSGHLPFEGDSAIDILHKHCTVLPPPLKELRPGLPEHVYHAINKGLAKKAELRFSSVTAFVNALKAPSDEITASDLETARMATPPSMQDRISTEVIARVNETRAKQDREQSAKPKAARRRLAVALGFAVLVVSGGLGWLWLTRQTGDSTSPGADVGASVTTPAESTASLVSGPSDSAAVQALSGGAVAAESTAAEPEVPPTAHLTLAGVPTGAAVTIDGSRRRGTDFELPPGLHTIRIEADGYESFVYEDRLIAGEQFRVPYIATAVAAAPRTRPAGVEPAQRQAPTPPPDGFLQIGVTPRATMFIDGVEQEPRRRFVDTLPPATYQLRFESEGYAAKDTTIEVRSGETTQFTIRLTEIRP